MSTCAKCGVNKYGKYFFINKYGKHTFHNNPSIDSTPSFYTFPKGETRDIWIRFVGIPGWQPKPVSVLCSRHFQDSDYCDDRTSKLVLRDNAVPTIEAKVKFPVDGAGDDTKAVEKPSITLKPIEQLIQTEPRQLVQTEPRHKKTRYEHPTKQPVTIEGPLELLIEPSERLIKSMEANKHEQLAKEPVTIDGSIEQLIEQNEEQLELLNAAEEPAGYLPDIRSVKAEKVDDISSGDIADPRLEKQVEIPDDTADRNLVNEELLLLGDTSIHIPNTDFIVANDSLASSRLDLRKVVEKNQSSTKSADTGAENITNPDILALKRKISVLTEQLTAKRKCVRNLNQTLRRQKTQTKCNHPTPTETEDKLKQLQEAHNLVREELTRLKHGNLPALRNEINRLRQENIILKKRLLNNEQMKII
uniref:THAP-type domain-containing protein n=1 Tax=Cacopsylla melanoneura TaxID=428564 RepID=A0A8D8SW94_9HEMI